MRRFDTGDSVRIDIPDETDPDHNRLHGRHGTVVEIISDDAGTVTDGEREDYSFVLNWMMATLLTCADVISTSLDMTLVPLFVSNEIE